MSGPVSLNSSNLASAEYDDERRVLIVTFRHGGTYEYSGVDADTASSLLSSASPGEYFARQIKNRFSYTKVTR